MDTRLVRTSNDRMIAGVAGGLARYFNIDPVIVRLVFVLAIFAGGVSPLVYLVLWMVMPMDTAAPVASTAASPAAHALPNHPRGPEQWKFDPYTGEPVNRQNP